MKNKHSKYKNTGILFELLVRQITADILENKESKAVDLLKEYFIKTELGKEYKLYEFLSKHKGLTENKASLVLNTILENSQHLNKTVLKKQKYNLIKEIKKTYPLEEFFKYRIPNYKVYASLFNLLENKINNADFTLKNKTTVLEHLTSPTQKSDLDEILAKEDKTTRLLTYKVLVNNYNKKYNSLSETQKKILKEYINTTNNKVKLKEFYNSQIDFLKKQLSETKIEDKTTQIKLNEISKFLVKLNKNELISENHIYNLLKFDELLIEIKKLNEKI